MKIYEKPVITLNDSVAEGVYAASGRPTCDSQHISGFRMGNGSGNTYIEYYGCSGCPMVRNKNGAWGCALTNGELDEVLANNGTTEGYTGHKPTWERSGKSPNASVDDKNLWN